MTAYSIEELEKAIRNIFAKYIISDADLQLGNFWIRKWKDLTNWVEDETLVLKE